jgi:hypothetical protein
LGRSVLAVLTGYFVFGASAAALFGLSGQDPHAVPSVQFAVGSVTYEVLFAGLAGFVAAHLSQTKPTFHAGMLAAIIAAIALLSLALQFRTGSIWSELATLFLATPAALIGGQMHVRYGRPNSVITE